MQGIYKNTKNEKTFVNKACETSRRKSREKKVTKKREPTADFVLLYIITAVYVSFTHKKICNYTKSYYI